jgi:hypothetical protein
VDRSKSASRNSSVTYATSNKEGLLEEDAAPPTTYSDDEIAFRDQLPPVLPYPVIEVGGANEPIEATGSPAYGAFAGVGLGHDTARGEAGHYIEPSLGNITTKKPHSGNQPRSRIMGRGRQRALPC